MFFFPNFLAKVLVGEGLGGLRGFHFVEIDLILLIGQGCCEGLYGCILFEFLVRGLMREV